MIILWRNSISCSSAQPKYNHLSQCQIGTQPISQKCQSALTFSVPNWRLLANTQHLFIECSNTLMENLSFIIIEDSNFLMRLFLIGAPVKRNMYHFHNYIPSKKMFWFQPLKILKVNRKGWDVYRPMSTGHNWKWQIFTEISSCQQHLFNSQDTGDAIQLLRENRIENSALHRHF